MNDGSGRRRKSNEIYYEYDRLQKIKKKTSKRGTTEMETKASCDDDDDDDEDDDDNNKQ